MKLQKELFSTIFLCFMLAFIFTYSETSYSWQYVSDSNLTKELKGSSVKCTITHTITAHGETPWIRLTAQIPQSITNIQKINRVEYSVQPYRVYEKNGLKYADIIIRKPETIEKVEITIFAEIYRYDLKIAKGNKERRLLQEKGLDAYLKEEKFIESSDSKIIEIAKTIKGRYEIDIVKNIYNYVLDNMEYVIQGKKDRGALYALKYKKGDCTEYSDLFVALCRAKKIPARVVSGISVHTNMKTAKHSWVEVYLEDFGWVPFDPTRGDVNNSYLRNRLFESNDQMYIVLSNIRNDSILSGYHFCLFTYYGAQIRVSDSIKFVFTARSN